MVPYSSIHHLISNSFIGGHDDYKNNSVEIEVMKLVRAHGVPKTGELKIDDLRTLHFHPLRLPTMSCVHSAQAGIYLFHDLSNFIILNSYLKYLSTT